MGYKYNDAAMMMATQVAYLDIDDKNGSVGKVVENLLDMYTEPDGQGNLVVKDGVASYYKKQAEVAINIDKLSREGNDIGNWKDWKVVDTCNDQHETGYYSMLIDTGNGDAIIGCRGSESYDLEQVGNDWIKADVGLLDNQLTAQQEMAQKYMEHLYYKYGDQYDTFSVSGHSLGGNLAEHMTITAPPGMREKIDHTISFDGPGFSQEYIDSHRDAIASAKDLMDHYEWSWVASLLISPPGVRDHIIKAHNEGYEDGLKAELFRHDTHNVEYDENGNTMPGDESALSERLGPISRYLEHTGEGGIEDVINTMIMGSRPTSLTTTALTALYFLKLIRSSLPQLEKLCKNLENWYYDHIAASASDYYKVKPKDVLASGAGLQKSVKSLYEMSEEIQEIRKNLKYWSTAGAYYRSRLILLKCQIDLNISSLNRLHSKLEPIMNQYEKADQEVDRAFAL